ncbi:alkane 1-monooxygenase [Acrasis kona]|uniref:Alkane 1-monooxygenase n=1 Tax=Acrasis kona TaxID=1008807 RepID=A0AAW2ZMD5_9EUKA
MILHTLAEKIHNQWYTYMIMTCLVPLLHLSGWFYLNQYPFALVPIFTFIVAPVADALLPQVQKKKNDNNKTVKHSITQSHGDPYYRASLYVYVFIHTLTLLYSVYKSQELLQKRRYYVFVLQILSLSIVSTAPAQAVGHELIHRLNTVDRMLGKFLFSLTMYSHFATEHVYGHHKNVATHKDPATARKGEWIYTFVFRSVAGSLIDACHIETNRLTQKFGTKTLSLRQYAVHHQVLQGIVLGDIVLPLVLWYIFGLHVCLTFVAQSITSIFFAESVNYCEHYGMMRKILPNGEYEPVTEKHSWDAPYTVSCFLYVNILLHSDHHAHPLKPYNKLEPGPEGTPTLPCGYATLFLMALIPPLYFKVMHSLPAFQN